MKKDYSEQLNTFLDEETREQAELYFEKYWLDKDEYIEEWLSIQESIFDSKAKYLPDMMFNKNFELFPLVGGNIFLGERDFTLLQNCLRQTGDTHFVIVQNMNIQVEFYCGKNDWIVNPQLRFKYPVNIFWDELMSGGDAFTSFWDGSRDYFVFGDSGNWGRYVANSWVQPSNATGLNPLNIMGFKQKYSEIFRRHFEQLRLLEPEITPEILFSEWLPDLYKQQP